MSETIERRAVWDPAQYERFADERSRPFRELIGRINHPSALRIADLGCGTGSLTAELAARWPAAAVEGIDSSPEMIEDATARSLPGRLEFRVGDLRDWEPDEPVDVLVSNATLQWVPGHLELLDRLAGFLAPGGVFAFQVPGNFDEPSHRLLAELRASERWQQKLDGQPAQRAAVNAPSEYLAALTTVGLAADVWETTYLQVLEGKNAVLEWMKGTALRPTLTALGPEDQEMFLAELGIELAAAYPETLSGTVLPFRRIFAVARRVDLGEQVADFRIAHLDHVQIAIPPGGEDGARGFYGDLLGLAECLSLQFLLHAVGAGSRATEPSSTPASRRTSALPPRRTSLWLSRGLQTSPSCSKGRGTKSPGTMSWHRVTGFM